MIEYITLENSDKLQTSLRLGRFKNANALAFTQGTEDKTKYFSVFYTSEDSSRFPVDLNGKSIGAFVVDWANCSVKFQAAQKPKGGSINISDTQYSQLGYIIKGLQQMYSQGKIVRQGVLFYVLGALLSTEAKWDKNAQGTGTMSLASGSWSEILPKISTTILANNYTLGLLESKGIINEPTASNPEVTHSGNDDTSMINITEESV